MLQDCGGRDTRSDDPEEAKGARNSHPPRQSVDLFIRFRAEVSEDTICTSCESAPYPVLSDACDPTVPAHELATLARTAASPFGHFENFGRNCSRLGDLPPYDFRAPIEFQQKVHLSHTILSKLISEISYNIIILLRLRT